MVPQVRSPYPVWTGVASLEMEPPVRAGAVSVAGGADLSADNWLMRLGVDNATADNAVAPLTWREASAECKREIRESACKHAVAA